MRGTETRQLLKMLRHPQYRAQENPWATASAAETLAQQGKYREAQQVRDEIGPSQNQTAMDPMEILILAEEHAAE